MPPNNRKPLTITQPSEAKLDKRVRTLFGKADLELQQVILDAIESDPNNPRGENLGDLESLIISVEEEGVRQPIYLRYMEESDLYRIVEGHRRVAASREARRTTIPAIILRGISDEEAAELSLMLNTQRLEIEQSRLRVFNQRYKEQGQSVRKRAAILGVSIGTISNWDNFGDLQDAGLPLRAFLEGELDANEAREELNRSHDRINNVQSSPTNTKPHNDEGVDEMILAAPQSKQRSVKRILEGRRKKQSAASRLISELRKVRYQVKDEAIRAEYELTYDEIGRALGLTPVFNIEQQQ